MLIWVTIHVASSNVDPRNCNLFADRLKKHSFQVPDSVNTGLPQESKCPWVQGERFVLQGREKLSILPKVLNACWMLKSLAKQSHHFPLVPMPEALLDYSRRKLKGNQLRRIYGPLGQLLEVFSLIQGLAV